jgi:hypothetical protein
MFGKKNTIVGVVCSDAGAANLIAPWIKFYNFKYKFYLRPAAKKVFKKYIPKITPNVSLEKLIKNSDITVTGTSTINNIENRARSLAIKNKKKVIAVMDHWVLYKESLIYRKKLVLPDEIWVTNNYAYIKSKKEFEKVKILKKKNFLEQSIKKIKKNKKKTNNYLYILEPINNSIEFIALKKFFLFLTKLNSKKKLKIIFKLHPREKKEKYKKYLNLFKKYNYKIVKDYDLKKLFIWSNIIFGLNSYALVLGKLANRAVYSLLPIKNFKSTIPYEIKSINKIRQNTLNKMVF